jgi:hypothetical protein
MEAKNDYTVSEVVTMSGKSLSTVTRRIESGELQPVPDASNPLRLTAESVYTYLRRLLDDGPSLPDGIPRNSKPAGDGEAAYLKRIEELERAVRDALAKVGELEIENETLRNDVQGLKLAHELVLDRLGAHTSPKSLNS